MSSPPLPVPQPPPTFPWSDPNLKPSLAFRQYMIKVDAALRALIGIYSGTAFPPSVPLIAVATPSNTHAAAAGVAVGQLYTASGADPAPVYVRTV